MSYREFLWFFFNREKMLFASDTQAKLATRSRNRGGTKETPIMTERLLERVLSRWDTKQRGELSRGDLAAALKEKALGLNLMPWEIEVLTSKALAKTKEDKARARDDEDEDNVEQDEEGSDGVSGARKRISIAALLAIVRDMQDLARAEAEAGALAAQKWARSADRF